VSIVWRASSKLLLLIKDKPQELDYLTTMKEIHRNNSHSYGRRRMEVVLENQDIFLGIFKIARLMKNAGLIAKVPKNRIIIHLESNYPLFQTY